MIHYFEYGPQELEYLKKKDVRLGAAIEQIGPVYREVIPDLFEALVHAIVGQQIATRAQATIWQRIKDSLGNVTPEGITAIPPEELQAFGISFRKVEYIQSAAQKILGGELDLKALLQMSDDEVCRMLSSLKGVGVWTAEMLMTFSMQRPNIMSFGDLAIHRGLRMLYHHRTIDRKLFEKYRRRYSPYATVASLYLWAIAGGALPGLKDYAPAPKGKTL